MIQAGTMSTGLGPNSIRHWLVLQELHQFVSVHDLPRRDGDLAARREILRTNWSLPCQHPLGILDEIQEPSNKVLPVFGQRSPQDGRMCKRRIRG
jgi:hypothetical protein